MLEFLVLLQPWGRRRDISLLNQVGLISILIVRSPGRGPRKLIWTIAPRIDLQARIR